MRHCLSTVEQSDLRRPDRLGAVHAYRTFEHHERRRVALGHRQQEALGALYDQLTPLVNAMALRILGDPAEAEEVLDETFTCLGLVPRAGQFKKI